MAQTVHETKLGRIEIVDQPEEDTTITSKKNLKLPLALLVAVLTIITVLLLRDHPQKDR